MCACFTPQDGHVVCSQPRKREQIPESLTPRDKDTKLSGWEKTGALFFGLVLITTRHYLPVIAYNACVCDKHLFIFYFLSLPSLHPPAANLSLHRQSGCEGAAVHSKSRVSSSFSFLLLFIYLFISEGMSGRDAPDTLRS